jgi:hypothetical protein
MVGGAGTTDPACRVAAIKRIAEQVEAYPEVPPGWVKQAQLDDDTAPSLPSASSPSVATACARPAPGCAVSSSP